MNRRSLAVALAGVAAAGTGLVSTVAARVSTANTTFSVRMKEQPKGVKCTTRWEHSHEDTQFKAIARCTNKSSSKSRDAEVEGTLYEAGHEDKRCTKRETIGPKETKEFDCVLDDHNA